MEALTSVLPAIIVLILGLSTHRIMLSLCSGILLASIMSHGFNPALNASKLIDIFLGNTFANPNNLYIFGFLLALGAIVTLIQTSGGIYAYRDFAIRNIKTKKDAETSSIFLSTLLFMDDYLSCLTVGSVMRPLTDSKGVPRIKLAFLVDTMAAPMAILCPFSSWVAAIMGFLRENGINDVVSENPIIFANPFSVYLKILPFLFYSFVLYISTCFLVYKQISFGPMRKIEQQTPDFNYEKAAKQKNHLFDFFGPIITLLLAIAVACLYSGNWKMLGGTNDAFKAMLNSNMALALFTGGSLTLVVTSIFFILTKKISTQISLNNIYIGAKLMFPAICVLILAWSLGDLLRDELHTGEQIAKLISGKVSINLLPTIFFYIATIIAFSLGSSWGTAAILFPIAIEMLTSFANVSNMDALSSVPLMVPVLAAILSGAVAGDHTSPISDTTIMSAISSEVKLMEHVHTQLPYALPIIISTGISFYLSVRLIDYGFIIASVAPIALACLTVIAVYIVLNKNK